MNTHVYISTACQHELHDKCRLVCKYCAADCACRCHGFNRPSTLDRTIKPKDNT